jgi:mRNA interferase RelE/StbE
MAYAIEFRNRVLKALLKLMSLIILLSKKQIYDLADEPRQRLYRKLKGRKGYRIRVGDYRVIYEIIDEIDVIDLGQKDIYE